MAKKAKEEMFNAPEEFLAALRKGGSMYAHRDDVRVLYGRILVNPWVAMRDEALAMGQYEIDKLASFISAEERALPYKRQQLEQISRSLRQGHYSAREADQIAERNATLEEEVRGTPKRIEEAKQRIAEIREQQSERRPRIEAICRWPE